MLPGGSCFPGHRCDVVHVSTQWSCGNSMHIPGSRHAHCSFPTRGQGCAWCFVKALVSEPGKLESACWSGMLVQNRCTLGFHVSKTCECTFAEKCIKGFLGGGISGKDEVYEGQR